PNEVSLQQQWTNKMLDRVIVELDSEAYDYISTDSTFNGNDELTGYTQTVQRDSQNAFTETNGISYNSNHQVGTISYSSNNRTITYGYTAGLDQVVAIAYSDIAGNFSVSYSALTNNLSSIAYPTGLGSGYETYTYEPAGRGRLTQITYPNLDTLAFSWNNKDQITQITFDDGTTETSYAITYNGMNKIASYTKSEDSYEVEEWTYVYGPYGLEYARKFVNDEEVLTQDFTTDQTGILLSMTYTEDDAQEGVNGEYYFHYDNFGNTVLLTDEDGVPQYTALYDISNGKRVQEWNPNSLDFAIKSEGQEEKISYEISDIQLTLHYELTVRKYSAIGIIGNKDWIDLTAENWRGGNTINLCGGCPYGKTRQCTAKYKCVDVVKEGTLYHHTEEYHTTIEPYPCGYLKDVISADRAENLQCFLQSCSNCKCIDGNIPL
ncbi:hypothetical protein LLG10_05840, partial [bacterium]|nr:hypothetical protein [bacterium]